MDSPTEYQAEIHRATTADEVAAILRRFLATFSVEETRALHPDVASVDTCSEQGMRRRALAAKRAAHAIDLAHPAAQAVSAAGKVMSTAALRISVLRMDEQKARRRTWF